MHAGIVIAGFLVPVFQTLPPTTMVEPRAGAGLNACYDIRVRGGRRFHFTFSEGTLAIERPSERRVDCHLSVEPLAFFLVAWSRQSQWAAIARGKLFAWGRRPWLGPRLRAVMRNP